MSHHRKTEHTDTICTSCPALFWNKFHTSTAIINRTILCIVNLAFEATTFAEHQIIMSRSQAQQTLFIPGAIPIAADTTSNPNLSWLQLPVPQDPNQSVITSPDDFIMWDLDQTALESLTSTSVQSAQSAYSPTYPSFASPRYGDGVRMPSSDELPGPPDWHVSNHTPVSRSEVPNAASKSDSESTRTKEVGSN